MSNSAPASTVTMSACGLNNSTFSGDGNTHGEYMTPGCNFTLSFTNAGNTRDGFSVSSAFAATSSTETASATLLRLTAYEQVQESFSYSISGGGAGYSAPVAHGHLPEDRELDHSYAHRDVDGQLARLQHGLVDACDSHGLGVDLQVGLRGRGLGHLISRGHGARHIHLPIRGVGPNDERVQRPVDRPGLRDRRWLVERGRHGLRDVQRDMVEVGRDRRPGDLLQLERGYQHGRAHGQQIHRHDRGVHERNTERQPDDAIFRDA